MCSHAYSAVVTPTMNIDYLTSRGGGGGQVSVWMHRVLALMNVNEGIGP